MIGKMMQESATNTPANSSDGDLGFTGPSVPEPIEFLNGKVRLHRGDCLTILPTLPENSLDACVTDPPYGLEFMGKDWDSFAPRNRKNAAVWDGRRQGQKDWEDHAVSRSGKGGGGPAYRSGHKGSPRCKLCGRRRFSGSPCECPTPEWVIEHRQEAPSVMLGYQNFMHEVAKEIYRVLKPGAHLLAFSGTRTYHRMACAIEDAGFEIRDQIGWCYGSGFPKSYNVALGIDKMRGLEGEIVGQTDGGLHRGSGSTVGSFTGLHAIRSPACDDSRQWQGWGTALKPAWEPIVIARKPISESSIAANVLRWGTGALNIDGCRIGTEGGTKTSEALWRNETVHAYGNGLGAQGGKIERVDGLGRWPANLIHDGSEEVVERFPEAPGQQRSTGPEFERNANVYGKFAGVTPAEPRGDSGSAARFFYSPKADQWDRITRFVEDVEVSWISESGPRRVKLQVDTDQSPEKAIVVSGSTAKQEWSTFLCGSMLTALFRKASACIISMGTNSTTDSKTWNLLIHSLTSGCTAVVNYAKANGGSPVASVGNGIRQITITLGETASLPGADSAMSRTQLTISVSGRRQHGHPTCKPVDLIQYLVRLVTPKGGLLLDPFAGTGTTGEAAWREGARAILVEREEEYQADIAKRMSLCLCGSDERRARSVKQEDHTSLPLFGANWG